MMACHEDPGCVVGRKSLLDILLWRCYVVLSSPSGPKAWKHCRYNINTDSNLVLYTSKEFETRTQRLMAVASLAISRQ